MANSAGWLILVGGVIVVVEAIRHINNAGAVAASAGASHSTTPTSVNAPGVTSVAPGSNESAGSPMPGSNTNVPGNSVNVGGGSIPGLTLGNWPQESVIWAQQQRISQNGNAQGLANAIDAIVIGESNGYPDAVGDNGHSHGLLQVNDVAFGATAQNPTVYRSLTNSLNINGVGNRILATYNRYVDMGIDPLSTPDAFAHFWADAQGAQYAPGNGSIGTSGLAQGVLNTLHQLFPSLRWQNQPGNNPQYLFQ